MKRLFSFLIVLSLVLTGVPVLAQTAPEGDYGVHYAKYGDLNLDGNVDAGDALDVLRIVVGKSAVEERLLPAADVDGQDGISATDGLRILQFSVNKLAQFAPGVYVTVHVWDGWVTLVPSTHDTEGLRQRNCLVCEAYEQEITPVIPAEIGEFERQVLQLVNEARSTENLAPLSYYTEGQAMAALRAEELNEYYSHTRPDGSECFTVLEGISYYAAGENIAIGYSSPKEVVQAWLDSPGHRANIMNEMFTHLIVGQTPARDPMYRGYAWVQLFIGI